MITGNSPSQVTTDNEHSTHIAGTIAAVKNNNLQVVGVAPQSKIMSISHSGFNIPNLAASQYASGINWAWQNGAEVINCSWGDSNGTYYTTFHPTNPAYSTLIEDALTSALTLGRNGKGCVIIFASGNYGGIDYPGNFDDRIITVGAINQTGQRAIFPPNQQSAYGVKLDVVAPGKDILSTSLDNSTIPLNGTSMAAPHVSGIAALILSINPCLTREQVTNIIEQTSQKMGGYNYTNTAVRPNGSWNEEVGYGLVDAYAAVVMAQQQLNPTNPDLYIADSTTDFGAEPSTSAIAWNSPDIWVRNQQDTNQTHQSPQYSPANPNYVYVKVRNRGCNPSTGTNVVKVYANLPNAFIPTSTYRISNPFFASHNTASIVANTFSFQLIGTITIPVLNSGQSVILSFPWNVPNPEGFLDCTSTNFDTFLYAKIVSATDVLAVPETTNNYQNIINNNNIAGKSSVILAPPNSITTNTIPTVYESSLLISNPSDIPLNINVQLVKEVTETGKLIYEESEVSLVMDETIYDAWQRGGAVSQNLNATTHSYSKRITSNNVAINNINILAHELGKIDLKFNFLTSEYTDKSNYKYHVIIKDSATDSIIGGTTYSIDKTVRNLFSADAGEDIAVNINQPITISAAEISEPATYNWYDTDGALIFTGKDLQIATNVATIYKLEVIASIDGFKDYSNVEVSIHPSKLLSISPNPASNEATVTYHLNENTSAYLMVLGSYGTSTSNNYILDLNSSTTTIDITSYPNGFYTIALVCNGNIVDAKTLVKQ